jgi:hypothetical protein
MRSAGVQNCEAMNTDSLSARYLWMTNTMAVTFHLPDGTMVGKLVLEKYRSAEEAKALLDFLVFLVNTHDSNASDVPA